MVQGGSRSNNSDDHDDEEDPLMDSDEESESSGGEEFTSSSQTNDEESNTAEREKREKEEVQALIRRETKSVLTWRETVTGILMIITFVACVATFVVVGREEHNAFETSFREAAIVISNRFASDSEQLSHDVKALAEIVTANAVSNNSTWPFVTIPFFEVYARHMRTTDGSDLILWAPIITEEQRPEWEQYSSENQGWLLDNGDATIEEQPNYNRREDNAELLAIDDPSIITPYIHHQGLDIMGTPPPAVPAGEGPYAPVWQISPPLARSTVISLDLFSYSQVERIYAHMVDNYTTTGNDEAAITKVVDYSLLGIDPQVGKDNETYYHPHSMLIAPISDGLLNKGPNNNALPPRGIVALSVVWDFIFQGVLPDDIRGIQVVVRNTCEQDRPFTYLLDGPDAIYRGEGEEVIDYFYEDLEYVVVSSYFTTTNLGGCSYTLHIYPTQTLRRDKVTDDKIFSTVAVMGLFAVVGIAFCFYDRSVQKRNEKMLKTATKSNLIVSSLFPSAVKKRLLEENEGGGGDGGGGGGVGDWMGATKVGSSSKPLADFFPEATVMFCDIVGFTAWSSVREPSQVFVLLETIYHAFDQIARRRRIFKIETIGDSYLCTAGLPEPRVDHAPAMARFAFECLNKMHTLVSRLEESLGPDTGDLSMRFGIHSGPVTAGVLRGERSRYQLFGDTVNTAARLESTGKRGSIHVSQETANLLKKMGKGHWLVPREDKVVAKGKGQLTTYWLVAKCADTASSHSSSLHSDVSHEPAQSHAPGTSIQRDQPDSLPPKMLRLVNWNVQILGRLLTQIVARRNATKSSSRLFMQGMDEKSVDKKLRGGRMVIHEVEEIITLPKYNASANASENQPIELDQAVTDQLRQFVVTIARSYHDKNPFHNFEHASHVMMSVSKLLSRIVAPKMPAKAANTQEAASKLLHDHTYGITSDPLTQFACIFSALIHDAQHDGVPNAQLVKEGTELAAKYKNQSVAEQNSVDVAWSILMQPQFKELRATIYCDEAEMMHFRKLIVNCVMATDIVDKDLKALRNGRWERAFAAKVDPPESHPESSKAEESKDIEDVEVDINRKATIVIEHLLQASDVSHTMQHWHVFRKWNENLFKEMYYAYRDGRAEKDPAIFWYKGEIGFFDFYIIPLAKKLRECGVFGVSSDEYLTYAESNRNEWESRGMELVKELSAKAKASYEMRNNGSCEKHHRGFKGSGSKEEAPIGPRESDVSTLKPLLPPSRSHDQTTYLSVRSSFLTIPTESQPMKDTVPFGEVAC